MQRLSHCVACNADNDAVDQRDAEPSIVPQVNKSDMILISTGTLSSSEFSTSSFDAHRNIGCIHVALISHSGCGESAACTPATALLQTQRTLGVVVGCNQHQGGNVTNYVGLSLHGWTLKV